MALKKDLNINISYEPTIFYPGIEENITREMHIKDTYVKINNINGNKNLIEINLGIYNEVEGVQIKSERYNFIPSVDDESNNFIKQGYEFLKTLPEYQEAIDC